MWKIKLTWDFGTWLLCVPYSFENQIEAEKATLLFRRQHCADRELKDITVFSPVGVVFKHYPNPLFRQDG